TTRHFEFRVRSADDSFGFSKARLRGCIFSPVVLHHTKEVFIRDDEHVGIGIDCDSGETRIRIFDGANRRTPNDDAFSLCLSPRKKLVSQPKHDSTYQQYAKSFNQEEPPKTVAAVM